MTLKSGFTLLETTIVIGIVSLLMTIGANSFVFSKQAARDSVRKTDIEQIRAALDFYKEENINRFYPAEISALVNVDTKYMDKIPKDPINADYCYSQDTGTSYILAAKLERGGPSSCVCNGSTYNYCFNPYGILLTPTPSLAPVTQPPATNTPIVSTPTPTTGLPITCNQIGKAYYNGQKYVVTLVSNYSGASWTVSVPNGLDCVPLAGSAEGLYFGTSCVNKGTSSVTVSLGSLKNTCQFSTILYYE